MIDIEKIMHQSFNQSVKKGLWDGKDVPGFRDRIFMRIISDLARCNSNQDNRASMVLYQNCLEMTVFHSCYDDYIAGTLEECVAKTFIDLLDYSAGTDIKTSKVVDYFKKEIKEVSGVQIKNTDTHFLCLIRTLTEIKYTGYLSQAELVAEVLGKLYEFCNQKSINLEFYIEQRLRNQEGA